MPLSDDVSVVVCTSGVGRALAFSAYTERRAQCEEAVRRLKGALPGIGTLRDVSPEEFEANLDGIVSDARSIGAKVVFLQVCCCLGDYARRLKLVAARRRIQVVEAYDIETAYRNMPWFKDLEARALGRVEQWYGRDRVAKEPYLKFYFPDRCHLNRFGAEAAARLLTTALAKGNGLDD